MSRAAFFPSKAHSEIHGTPTQTDEPSSRQAHISQFPAKSSIFCYIFKSNVYQQHSNKTWALCHHSADAFRVFFPLHDSGAPCVLPLAFLLLFCKHFINHSPRLFYHIQDISSSQLSQKTRHTELLSGEGKIAWQDSRDKSIVQWSNWWIAGHHMEHKQSWQSHQDEWQYWKDRAHNINVS